MSKEVHPPIEASGLFVTVKIKPKPKWIPKRLWNWFSKLTVEIERTTR